MACSADSNVVTEEFENKKKKTLKVQWPGNRSRKNLEIEVTVGALGMMKMEHNNTLKNSLEIPAQE